MLLGVAGERDDRPRQKNCPGEKKVQGKANTLAALEASIAEVEGLLFKTLSKGNTRNLGN